MLARGRLQVGLGDGGHGELNGVELTLLLMVAMRVMAFVGFVTPRLADYQSPPTADGAQLTD